MRALIIEFLDGKTAQAESLISSDSLSEHGRFISRNGGIDVDHSFVPFHAIRRICFYLPPAPAIEAMKPKAESRQPRNKRK